MPRPNAADAPQFVDIPEFSKRTGLSDSTIRRRIRDGSLQSWQPGGPRTRLLLPLAQMDAPSENLAPRPANPSARSQPERLSGPQPRWKR
jgi:excisionase family DNA binding protein